MTSSPKIDSQRKLGLLKNNEKIQYGENPKNSQ